MQKEQPHCCNCSSLKRRLSDFIPDCSGLPPVTHYPVCRQADSVVIGLIPIYRNRNGKNRFGLSSRFWNSILVQTKKSPLQFLVKDFSEKRRLSTLPLLTQYHRRDWAYPPAGGSEWEEVEWIILSVLKLHPCTNKKSPLQFLVKDFSEKRRLSTLPLLTQYHRRDWA